MILASSPDDNEVRLYRTIKCNVKACTACDSCANNKGQCVLKDDMQAIYEDIIHSDKLLFITPVYFSGFPSSLKAIIDRCQMFYNYPELKDTLPTKQAYILAIGGSRPYPDQFTGIESSLRYLLRSINCRLEAKLYFTGTDSFNDRFDDDKIGLIRDFALKMFTKGE